MTGSRLPGSCFVTGLDELDGEGLVAPALAHHLRRMGLAVAAMTPVAADAQKRDGRWTSPQLARLGAAGSFGLPEPALSPYVVPPAASAEQAVQDFGLCVDPEDVADAYQVLATWTDVVVVQGVGGLQVPLGAGLRVCDVAARLALPLVLALRMDGDAPARAARALEAATQAGLSVAGWVATELDPGAAAGGIPLLGPPLACLAPGEQDARAAALRFDAPRTAQALQLPPRGGAALPA